MENKYFSYLYRNNMSLSFDLNFKRPLAKPTIPHPP